MSEKKLSNGAINRSWIIWFFWHGCSQQGETLLGNAMGHTMVPVIEELYDSKEDKVAAYNRALTLFNTEQQVGAIAPGILIGAEESIANNKITPELAESIKIALIGPTSAIGDSLWVATIIPLFITLCMTITNMNGIFIYIGPLIYAIAYPVITAFISNRLWNIGYKTGIEGIQSFINSDQLDNITKSMNILGTIVVGALAASFINITIPWIVTPPGGEMAAVDVDIMLNNIFPKIIPLLLTLFIYNLYTKKKKTTLFIMGLILTISILLTVLGYLTGYYA